MKNEWHITLMASACIASWFLWVLVLIFIAPEDLGVVGIGLFFAALWGAVFTLFLLILYYIRIKFIGLRPIYKQFHIIFRESSLAAFASIVWLYFLHLNIFTLLNVALILFLIFLIDILAIITYDGPHYKKH